MRTRNSDNAKPVTPRKTPPARKNAVKTPPTTSEASAAKSKLAKVAEAFLEPTNSSDIKTDQSSEGSASQAEIGHLVKSSPRRTPVRNRAQARAISTPIAGENADGKCEETESHDNNAEVEGTAEEPQNVEVPKVNMDVDLKDDQIDSVRKTTNDEVTMTDNGKFIVKNLGSSWMDQKTVDLNIAAYEEDDEHAENEQNIAEENKIIGDYDKKGENVMEADVMTGSGAAGPLKQEEPTIMEVVIDLETVVSPSAREEARVELNDDELKDIRYQKDLKEEYKTDYGVKGEYHGQLANMSVNEKSQDDQALEENFGGDEGIEGYSEKLDLGEHREEDDLEEDPEELPEETETLEEERRELTANAKERKIKKEHEIFVGGLDREATEVDLKRVFNKIGEVVEVRLHKDPSTNRNKGYAFVKFANKEHAKRALSEMKNPVIHGKRCGTAPSEDNDTLFLGNICNTWTKEAIKQKLKDYGVEGVENITLVPDALHEGLSRGFAFVEFACHVDAMLAYKRLRKPDAIFGHPERTAKVAFAEPIREADPEIMAQVKSVFVDGLLPHWDEDRVREHFKGYGEIVKIVLARNMSTAKRRDFGFIDFSTHEFAVACVDGINNSELCDGSSKVKIRARLSNPLPKTQAVKGGMSGGFRIGHARSGNYPRRNFLQGGRSLHRGNFQHGRDFNHSGHSENGRMGFRDLHHDNQYPNYARRQFVPRGGRRGARRDVHFVPSRGVGGSMPPRPYFDRPWYAVPDGPRNHMPPRRPFSPEASFDRSFVGSPFEDSYLYDDNVQSVKRPLYTADHEPDYMGPSRRPRLDYNEPAPFYPGNRFPGSFGAGSSPFSNDYYSDYGRGPYSDFSRGDASSRRGYYY